MTRFTKGHGTENDFVLVPDPDGTLELTPVQVRRLADRHAGLGGDGVIRVVPTRFATEDAVRGQADQAEWFMDYRNADGSLAEMCGNGTRVFAAYLVREGLVGGDRFDIATRAGRKRVRTTGTGFAVDLGPWRLVDEQGARRDGFDIMVRPRHGKPVPALSLDLGNPHAVVMLPEGIDLAALDLTEPPQAQPVQPAGVNVEFVRPVGPGRIEMRVHERGVGETRSCGTGAAAAALATRFWSGVEDESPWLVDVPGGRLTVTPLPGGRVELAGPAELVADGEFHL
ncbi:MAG: diaminopimelate epimerase [Intrasporangium sp.]|uniref:diaminopimelate epimerase n=1 Tax=Intrasporangium sp. TaxID=1925024 RepID=UPI00264A02FE|nr:diaminopimelate epimerase [Intrasporangium sp.]MDN5796338.1 diaminopimelate epimerase [Intrasporangium sp.]